MKTVMKTVSAIITVFAFCLTLSAGVHASERDDLMPATDAEDEIFEYDGTEEIYTEDKLPGSDELLGGFLQMTGLGDDISYRKEAEDERRSRLGERERKIYDCIKQLTEHAASGEISETTVFIPAGLYLDTQEFSFDEQEAGTDPGSVNDLLFYELADFDKAAVFDSIIADHPYELYWFDTTKGMGFVPRLSYSRKTEEGRVTYTLSDRCGMQIRLYVAADYNPAGETGTTCLDSVKTGKAAGTVKNAAAITEDAHNLKSDLDRLIYYRDVICELTDYDREAVSGREYGDPWQIINIFDKDPETKAVCEGYAKAFKYLCDMTDFNDKKTACHTVSGYCDKQPHMWNSVRMDNGMYYLADITNCDNADDSLFLAGATPLDPEDRLYGYRASTDRGGPEYIHDENSRRMYDEELIVDYLSYTERCMADRYEPEPEPEPKTDPEPKPESEPARQSALPVKIQKIRLSCKNATVVKGTTKRLNVIFEPSNALKEIVIWKSSNRKVATVDANGNVRGIRKGRAVITAKTSDGRLKVSCRVTVRNPVRIKSIRLNKKKLRLKTGSVYRLWISFKPHNATYKTVKWKSSDPKTVMVDNDGKVKALRPGKAVITVISVDRKKKARCKVTVR